ncbi:unnamed protein product, partial [Vitis vinifera]
MVPKWPKKTLHLNQIMNDHLPCFPNQTDHHQNHRKTATRIARWMPEKKTPLIHTFLPSSFLCASPQDKPRISPKPNGF